MSRFFLILLFTALISGYILKKCNARILAIVDIFAAVSLSRKSGVGKINFHAFVVGDVS
ncbi:MAG: hypothetical protein DSM106950_20745 [Stigonema ocellatum SAG 48.90 = DSM 106950]|nr:hypothetical protein [Stigonema ocellatum SAG 48.90 = DSM 106950]